MRKWFDGQLGFQYVKYRTFVGRGEKRTSQYPSLLVRFRSQRQFGGFVYRTEVEGFATLSRLDNRYLNVVETYAGTGIDEQESGGFRFYVGRKIEEWCVLDDHWRLGLWQPRFRWDYFEPETVGLSGLFFKASGKKWQAVAFGSPLYIPEQGATFQASDGLLVSSHPFFSPPPSTLSVFDQQTQLRYNINIPPIKDILFNPSAGAFIRVGEARGYWGKLSYTFSPMNQLGIGYEGYLYIPTNQVEVKIYPRVVYRHLAALEAGYRSSQWDAFMSVVGERPTETNVPTDLTVQRFSNSLLLSPGVSYRVSGEGAVAHRLSLGFIQTFGGVEDDQGPIAVPGQQLFESRMQYRRAVQGRWRLPLVAKAKQKLIFNSKVVYEFAVRGMLVSMDLRYSLSDRWSFGIGAEAVAAGRKRASNGGADFFGLYRGNDRMRGMIAYAF
jgi:hypothetical protein